MKGREREREKGKRERGREGERERERERKFPVIPFHSHSKLKAWYTDRDQKGYLELPSVPSRTSSRFLGFGIIANLEKRRLARNHNYGLTATVGHSNE